MIARTFQPLNESPSRDKAWHIASRWQEFNGEMRTAILRAILVLVFYSIQVVQYVSLATVGDLDRLFHRQVTFAAIAWLFLSMSILLALRGGFMHPLLKYVSTGIDLGLVTLLAWLSRGPNSPLVTALFLVLVMSSLRFRIGLIWFATLSSMACYTLLVGSVDRLWFDANHETPIVIQAVTLCSLASTGVVLGQVVRSARSMADAFHLRVTPLVNESAVSKSTEVTT